MHLRRIDGIGETLLRALCLLGAAVSILAIVDIAYQVFHGAQPAFARYGFQFLRDSAWKPNFNVFGAAPLLYGTAVTSLMALALATPVGIAIGLYLSLLAPRGVRAVVGPLVEMLAAIPSVILGFWGILVLGPFVRARVEPWLHDHLGMLPIFGAPQTSGSSIFTAGLILTIMVVPIIASVSRDLFQTVPRELTDGAEALGATRWELGLGRALGEAIAVTQVIGAGSLVHASLFQTGDTLASRIANQFQGAVGKLHISALFYLAAVLLVFGIATNLFAQWIGHRFDRQVAVAR
jgi:phosphate transport system permease protein